MDAAVVVLLSFIRSGFLKVSSLRDEVFAVSLPVGENTRDCLLLPNAFLPLSFSIVKITLILLRCSLFFSIIEGKIPDPNSKGVH